MTREAMTVQVRKFAASVPAAVLIGIGGYWLGDREASPAEPETAAECCSTVNRRLDQVEARLDRLITILLEQKGRP